MPVAIVPDLKRSCLSLFVNVFERPLWTYCRHLHQSKWLAGSMWLIRQVPREVGTVSGAQGVSLEEANKFTRSLSVLYDIIKCLGDSDYKSKRGRIPYRNSTLTLIMKDRLGTFNLLSIYYPLINLNQAEIRILYCKPMWVHLRLISRKRSAHLSMQIERKGYECEWLPMSPMACSQRIKVMSIVSLFCRLKSRSWMK